MQYLPIALASLMFQAAAADTLPGSLRLPEFHLSEAYNTCNRLSGGVTTTQIDCAHEELARLDQILNHTWRDAMARLPNKTARSALRRQQRDWLRTRWAECDERVEESGVAGSESAILIYAGCQIEVVARRISVLRGWRSTPQA